MPELPEVETVRKYLQKEAVGEEIKSVEVLKPKIVKEIPATSFKKKLKNQKINKVRRRGKYLLIDLDDYTLVSHLRMEGYYHFNEKPQHPVTKKKTIAHFVNLEKKHDHIIFKFKSGRILSYNDSRQFGTMELVNLKDENSLKGVAKQGLEPGDEKLDVDYFIKETHNRKVAIKKILLEQTTISGLGNIYVDECLFASYIHPLTPVSLLSGKEIKLLLKEINIIIKEAIKMGGTTISSFTPDGEKIGFFQQQLKVYQRKGKPCLRCETLIEKIVVGGRGTHFCPQCQKEKK